MQKINECLLLLGTLLLKSIIVFDRLSSTRFIMHARKIFVDLNELDLHIIILTYNVIYCSNISSSVTLPIGRYNCYNV